MSSLDEIRQLFFVECEEQLELLTDGLGEIDALPPGEPPSSDTINTMFRAVHSIKGGAASFSLDAITKYAHTFETVLDEVRGGKLALGPELIRTFYSAADYLSELVALGADGEEPDETSLLEHISVISAMSSDPAALPVSTSPESGEPAETEGDLIDAFTPLTLDFDFAPPAEHEGFTISFRPTAALFSNGHEPAFLFRELEQLGTLRVDVDLDAEMTWNAKAPGLIWHLTLVTSVDESQIREIFEFAEPFAELEIAPISNDSEEAPAENDILAAFSAPGDPEPSPSVESAEDPAETTTSAPAPAEAETHEKAKPTSKATVRVDLELVDDLINMVGELVITQSVMTQSIAEAGLDNGLQLSTTLDEFKSLTRHIQEGIMAIRAQSVKPLFQRMGRIVRETAQISEKNVKFVTDGEDTEVDRTVIERLVDPLTHILRNAVDHGLEHAEQRQEVGKEPTGTVTLSAAHRSGRVVIDVKDDGAGVNRERVLASAIRKGLIPPDAVLGPAEIDRLLFTPGFSTAASVTNLSGRGVGMDVVNTEIKRLGGRVSIISEPGTGTTISISLPLTLAVLDGMVVDVAGQTMVVPISAIVETIRPEKSMMHMVGPSSKIITVRDKVIPVIDLGGLFGFSDQPALEREGILMLVEDDNGDCRALAIDSIHDQRQVVIKSLEANYGHVPFVAAATILGDGKIALIVDLDEIIHQTPPAAALLRDMGVPA